MPHYLETDDRELLEKLRKAQVCAECGHKLGSFYDIRKHLPYLVCLSNPEHEGIAREYKPPAEDYESNIRRTVELENAVGMENTRALANIPKQGQLTQPQAKHILSLVYPGVPKDEIIRCAILCRDFGLHPLMKEVYIIPFGQGDKRTWATVLGINATRKIMSQRGTYSYTDDTPRLMTDKEQMRIFGEIDKFNIVAITKLRTKDGLEAPGYGRWPSDKAPYGMDKGNTKANMAFIRSERNAFGRLSPDALPVGVEVIDEAYVDVPDVGKVDKLTGEVVEGTAEELPDEEPELVYPEEKHWCEEHNCEFFKRGRMKWWAHKIEGTDKWCSEKTKKEPAPAKEPAQEVVEAEVDKPDEELTPKELKRDPATVTTIEKLTKALTEDYGLTIQQQWDFLNIKDWNELAIAPSAAYIEVAATY